MKYYLFILAITLTPNLFADSCLKIARYDELMSQIYVVCPDLSEKSKLEINEIVSEIFSSREFIPDEYTIDFVSSSKYLSQGKLTKTTHIGRYYTHNNQVTIWPKKLNSKLVIQLRN